MVNTDKVKAARTGSDVKYKKKLQAIHNAGRAAHAHEKRVTRCWSGTNLPHVVVQHIIVPHVVVQNINIIAVIL